MGKLGLKGQIVVGIVGIVIITYGVLFYYKHFAPKFEGARREVFEKTRSYNQAKLQELSKYRLEYLKAEGNDKTAIASTIQHKFADYDIKSLPSELQEFLKEIRGY